MEMIDSGTDGGTAYQLQNDVLCVRARKPFIRFLPFCSSVDAKLCFVCLIYS